MMDDLYKWWSSYELSIHEIHARNHCGKGVCQAVLVEVVKPPPRKWQ